MVDVDDWQLPLQKAKGSRKAYCYRAGSGSRVGAADWGLPLDSSEEQELHDVAEAVEVAVRDDEL